MEAERQGGSEKKMEEGSSSRGGSSQGGSSRGDMVSSVGKEPERGMVGRWGATMEADGKGPPQQRESGRKGRLKVERVGGRSAATVVFAGNPLKFILPKNVSTKGVDAIWAYVLSYGGGIVAGDYISFSLEVADGCTLALTTQASTKVYHSLDGVGARQEVEAVVGDGALLAFVPDPVVCFANSTFVQSQVFHLAPAGSLVLVDWLTSGRLEGMGESWKFDLYESFNRLLVDGKQIFLDKVRLQQGSGLSVSERMHNMHVVGLVLLYGPRTLELQASMEAAVASKAPEFLRHGRVLRKFGKGLAASEDDSQSQSARGNRSLLVSCSRIGPQGEGMVLRIAATTFESAYQFLNQELSLLSTTLGAAPYPLIY